MGAYKDAMHEQSIRQYQFSENQPEVPMKITAQNERVQPTMIGVDEKGEPIWEGKQMDFWQMVLLPVRYLGDFANHWNRQAMLTLFGMEDDRQIASMELRVDKKWCRKKVYRHQGD